MPMDLSANEFFENFSVKQAIEGMGDLPLSAIIDVGAYFKNEDNEQIAESLLSVQKSVFFSQPEQIS